MEQPRATVLVVDDDPEVLAIAVATVSALGYAAIPAHSGQEALSILQRELAVDLLFTDITMPAGMNGWELGRQSRHLRPGLRVIYTTGYTRTMPEVDGPGCGPLLPKPWRPSQLATLLRAVLESDPS
jgi:CheY-like chemotaxis protein